MKRIISALIVILIFSACNEEVSTVYLPTPTTEIKWGGNLKAESSVTQTQNVVQTGNITNNATIGDTVVIETIIYNDYGDDYKVKITYTKTAVASEWDVKAEIYDPSGILIPDADLDKNELAEATDVLKTFDAGGALSAPATDHIYTISDLDEGLCFTIDISAITASKDVNTLSSVADDNRTSTLVEGSLYIYDSLGNPHKMTLRFTMEDPTSNTWNFRISVPVSSGTLDVYWARGTVSFNDDGSLDSVNPQNPAQVQFTPSTGATVQTIKQDFGTTNGFDGITQTSANSVISALSQNGSDRDFN